MATEHPASDQTGQPASEQAQRAARTYGAAADHYQRDALSFRDRFGAATVSRLPLAPGGTRSARSSTTGSARTCSPTCARTRS
jgi:hypothetical protein